MSIKSKNHLLFALALTASAAANAGLTGDQVQAHWTYGSFDQLSTVTVGSGVELDKTWGLGHSLDVGDNYIEALLPDVGGIGSGVHWHFSSLDFGGIGHVAVSTNFSGWNNSWVTFGNDWIDVAFAGSVSLPLNAGQIRFTMAPIPEPSTVALMALGVPLLLSLARRRR